MFSLSTRQTMHAMLKIIVIAICLLTRTDAMEINVLTQDAGKYPVVATYMFAKFKSSPTLTTTELEEISLKKTVKGDNVTKTWSGVPQVRKAPMRSHLAGCAMRDHWRNMTEDEFNAISDEELVTVKFERPSHSRSHPLPHGRFWFVNIPREYLEDSNAGRNAKLQFKEKELKLKRGRRNSNAALSLILFQKRMGISGEATKVVEKPEQDEGLLRLEAEIAQLKAQEEEDVQPQGLAAVHEGEVYQEAGSVRTRCKRRFNACSDSQNSTERRLLKDLEDLANLSQMSFSEIDE